MKLRKILPVMLAVAASASLAACGSTGGSTATTAAEAATFPHSGETEATSISTDEVTYFDRNAVPGEALCDVGDFTVYIPEGWYADPSYVARDRLGRTVTQDEPVTDTVYVAKVVPDTKEDQGALRNGSAYICITRKYEEYVAGTGEYVGLLGSAYEGVQREPAEIGGATWEGYDRYKDGELDETVLYGRIDDSNWFYVEINPGSATGADITLDDEDVISVITSISEQILAEQALGK